MVDWQEGSSHGHRLVGPDGLWGPGRCQDLWGLILCDPSEQDTSLTAPILAPTQQPNVSCWSRNQIMSLHCFTPSLGFSFHLKERWSLHNGPACLISALLLLFQPLLLLLSTSLPPSTWTTLVFCFLIFIYLTALGLSCSMQDLCYIMQALLLWHTDSSYGTQAQ